MGTRARNREVGKSGLTASVLAASEILTNDRLFEGCQDSVESSIPIFETTFINLMHL